MISICVLRLTICLLIISFQGSPLGLVRLVRNLSKKKRRERRTGQKAFLSPHRDIMGKFYWRFQFICKFHFPQQCLEKSIPFSVQRIFF